MTIKPLQIPPGVDLRSKYEVEVRIRSLKAYLERKKAEREARKSVKR